MHSGFIFSHYHSMSSRWHSGLPLLWHPPGSTPLGETDLARAHWERPPLVGQNPAPLHPSPQSFGQLGQRQSFFRGCSRTKTPNKSKFRRCTTWLPWSIHTPSVQLVICLLGARNRFIRCLSYTGTTVTSLLFIIFILVTKKPKHVITKQDSFPLWPQSHVPA